MGIIVISQQHQPNIINCI